MSRNEKGSGSGSRGGPEGVRRGPGELREVGRRESTRSLRRPTAAPRCGKVPTLYTTPRDHFSPIPLFLRE
eukprot:292792-Prorocentrum_minimum.AAC.1